MTSPGGREAGRVSVRVVPDSSKFAAALRVDLQRLESTLKVSIPTELDTTGLSAHAKAASAAAEQVAGTVHIRTEVDRASFSQATTTLNSFSGRLGLIVAAVTTLGPALVPVLAALTAVVGGLAVPIAAATAGVGAFAVFAVPAFTSVAEASEDLAKAQEAVDKALTSKTRQTALIRQRQLIASMNPAIAAAVVSLNALKDTYRKLSAALAPQIFGVFNAGLQVATAALPLFAQLTRAVAPALTGLAKQLAGALSSPAVKQFVTFLGAQAGPAILGFGKILGNLSAGFAGLLQAFAPVGESLLDGLVRLSAGFAGLSKTDGFQKFLAFATANLPLVGKLTADLVRGISALTVALAPMGIVVVKALDLMVRGITAAAQQVPILIPALIGLFAVFQLAGPAAVAFTFLVSPIGLVVAGLALLAIGFVALYKNSQPVRDVIAAIGVVVRDLAEKALPVLRGVFQQAMLGVRAAIADVSAAIVENRPQIDQLIRGFRTAAGFILTEVVPVLGPILRGVFASIGPQIASTITIIGGLVSAFNTIRSAVIVVGGAIAAAWSAVGMAVTGAGTAAQQTGGFFTSLWARITGIVSTAAAAVVGFVVGMWQRIVAVFQAAMAIVAGIWSAFWNSTIGGLVSAVIGLIVAVVKLGLTLIVVAFVVAIAAITAGVRAGLTFIQAIWSAVMGYLTARATAAWARIVAVVSYGVNAVRSVVSTVMAGVQAVVTVVWGRISSVVASAVARILVVVRGVSAVAAIIGNAFGSARSAAETRIGQIVSLARGIGGRVLSAVGNLGSILFNAGKGIIQGLINGIQAGLSGLTAIINSVTARVTAVRGMLKIKSPSRVMMDIGSDAMAGLIAGLGKQMPALSAQARAAADAITGVSPSMSRSIGDALLGQLAPAGPGQGGGGHLTGNLYLNDGTFLGVIEGAIATAQDDLARQVTYRRR